MMPSLCLLDNSATALHDWYAHDAQCGRHAIVICGCRLGAFKSCCLVIILKGRMTVATTARFVACRVHSTRQPSHVSRVFKRICKIPVELRFAAGLERRHDMTSDVTAGACRYKVTTLCSLSP